MDIIEENIHDNEKNHTRFIIIGKHLESSEESNKSTICFSLDNNVGTLYNLLRHFVENNINMIKIESRPSNTQLWEYVLYADIEGNINDDNVKEAINLINKECPYFRFLGCYKKKDI